MSRVSEYRLAEGTNQRERRDAHETLCENPGQLDTEFALRLSMVFVSSERNRADVLTRGKKTWLHVPEHLKLLQCVD